MADMTIDLRRDPVTGKNVIHVKLDSDADALPLEHETLHRLIVEKLVGKKIGDFGEVVIEREPEAAPAGSDAEPTAPAQQTAGARS
jgi:hypothetical protein